MNISIPIHRSEINAIFKIAAPLMAAFVAQKGMQLIDLFMMGWLGNQAMAAGALGTSVFICVLIFCMGTISAIGVCIARHRGANQYESIPATMQNGIYLGLLLAIPGMILIWNMPWVLLKIGEQPAIIEYTQRFLHGIVWGFPGALLFLVFREFVAAFSLTRIIMIVTLSCLPCTFLLNYIFIYGEFGLPAMGIAGIGYASAIVMWLMFFSIWLYSAKHPELKNYITSLLKINVQVAQIKEFFAIGIPSGLMLLLDGGLFTMAAIMMGYLGADALAAHQVAIQYAALSFSIPFGLSMATALLVGHAAGANDLRQAKRYTYISLSIGIIFATIIGLIFIFIPEKLASLFLSSNTIDYTATIKLTASFLMIAVLFQYFDSIQTILTGCLRGLKDTFVPLVLCFSSYWILGIGSAYYLTFHTAISARGIWYGLTIGISTASIILLFRFITIFKRYGMGSGLTNQTYQV